MKKILRFIMSFIFILLFTAEIILLSTSYFSQELICTNTINYGSDYLYKYLNDNYNKDNNTQMNELFSNIRDNIKNSTEIKQALDYYLTSIKDPNFYKDNKFEVKIDEHLGGINTIIQDSFKTDKSRILGTTIINSIEGGIVDKINEYLHSAYDNTNVKLSIGVYSFIHTLLFNIIMLVLILIELLIFISLYKKKTLIPIGLSLLLSGLFFNVLKYIVPTTTANQLNLTTPLFIPKGLDIISLALIVIGIILILSRFFTKKK